MVTPAWVRYTFSAEDYMPKGQYGAQWWLNKGKRGKRKFPGLPSDMVMCRGYQGQRIYVIPSKKLVVTRFGKTSDETAFHETAFLQRIFACLP